MKWLLLRDFLLFTAALANPLKEKHNQHDKCETLTVTHVTSETLIVASTVKTVQTVTHHGPAKKTVTVTQVVAGGTVTVTEGGDASATVTVTSTSVIRVGYGPTTVTSTVFPYATTTITGTTTTTVLVPGSTTVIYPTPPTPTESYSNFYTGAPTSLFLSVI